MFLHNLPNWHLRKHFNNDTLILASFVQPLERYLISTQYVTIVVMNVLKYEDERKQTTASRDLACGKGRSVKQTNTIQYRLKVHSGLHIKTKVSPLLHYPSTFMICLSNNSQTPHCNHHCALYVTSIHYIFKREDDDVLKKKKKVQNLQSKRTGLEKLS